MVLLCHFAGDTLTFIAILMTTGTVPTAPLHQETAWPENGVRLLELFPDGH